MDDGTWTNSNDFDGDDTIVAVVVVVADVAGRSIAFFLGTRRLVCVASVVADELADDDDSSDDVDDTV